MRRILYAISAATIIAGAFVAILSLSPQVEAHSSLQGLKADRAAARPLATACSQRAWPYIQAACLRDTRNPYGQARQVRIISADRLASH